MNRTPQLVAAAVAAALAAAPAGADLASALQQHRIQAIRPPSPASDFTLENLAGGRTSLSDFYGSWVVLTFFATWCGPCRSELPSLEKLHQDRADDGVVVLGVSIDDDRKPLDPFVRQLGLTFPIVWDATKQVGAAYRASAIPVSYLVDPEGRLVGVARGSRDWSALTPLMDAALAAVPATQSAEARADAYADAAQPVAAPTVTDPPTAELALATATPTAGKPFHLDVKLRWAGNFDEYLPHPPEILLPEGVTRQDMTAESSSRDGRNQLTYRVTLVAAAPGKYALDPVELRYTPRFESTPVARRVAGPTVEVAEPTVLGLTRRGLTFGALGLLLLVAVAGLVVGFGAMRRKARVRPAGEERFARLSVRLEEARRKRLQGDGAGALLALAGLDRELGGDDDPELGAAVERARYGGATPPAAELDRLQRRVERRLAELRPDPEKEERERVKLKDTGGR